MQMPGLHPLVKPEDDKKFPSFSHLMRESMLLIGVDLRVKPEDDEIHVRIEKKRLGF
jgi:hypothetical protein